MRYYAERTLQALVTVLIVVTVTFVMIRLIPGGPMDFMRAQLIQQAQGGGDSVDMARVNELVEAYTNVQPDKPMWQQYIDYVAALAQGDLGQSVWYDRSVSSILAAAIPWTVFILGISLAINFVLGIGLGALMAYFEGSRFDVGSTMFAILSTSVPYYVVAIVMVYVLGYQLGWFPTGGRLASDVEVGLSVAFVRSALYHAALPVISLVTGFAGLAISMRANSISVLGEDYIRVARLRGIRTRNIALRHVVRNAILPIWTQLLISIGFLFGGSIILETIFAYHGVGYFMYQAIQSRDYPLMMGGFLVITVAVVISVYVADLSYGKIDPRVTTGGDE
ncbi:ABC transporter permease [Halosimplex amylolyticum]|uniref:ABC transporter permease n=1 Tax=Halosimplex amylolyticum TaxID=3396616 RepID=UPI003F577E33